MTEGEVRAPDGRRVAWATFGAPSGRPILYCHGFLGSRLEPRLAADSAGRLGVRLVGVDRPGCGRSDPAPGRRLTDWAGDLARVADHLHAGRFAVLGVSGGAPYAAACAWALPGRVSAAGIVCGLGPLQVEEANPPPRGGHPAGERDRLRAEGCRGASRTRALEDMGWPARLGLQVAAASPALSRLVLRVIAVAVRGAADRVLAVLSRRYPPTDRAVLARPEVRQAILDSLREGVRQGGPALADEANLLTRPWGFALGDLRTPVWLWHGEADRTVPVSMAREVAAAIPGCRARFLADEGHFSLPVNCMDEVLSALAG